MARIFECYKTLFAIVGFKFKVDGSGNVWGGIDKSNQSCTTICKDYNKLEWIIAHPYILENIERRIRGV